MSQLCSRKPAATQRGAGHRKYRWAGGLLVVGLAVLAAPVCSLAADLDLSKKSAATRKLQRAMRNRAPELKSYLIMGHIGVDKDGFLTVRSLANVPPIISQDIRKKIAAENTSRKAMVAAVGAANGIGDDDKDELAAQLSRQWRRKVGGRWWVQDDKGKWRRGPIR